MEKCMYRLFMDKHKPALRVMCKKVTINILKVVWIIVCLPECEVLEFSLIQ